jgi:hypothetical protein
VLEDTVRVQQLPKRCILIRQPSSVKGMQENALWPRRMEVSRMASSFEHTPKISNHSMTSVTD